MNFKKAKNNKGFVLLFTITLIGIILAITLGVANIALKEINFSTSARDSNEALFAADTGMECGLFNDKSTANSFVPSGGSGKVQCLNSSVNLTGAYPAWSFILSGLGSSSQACSIVTVTKDTVSNAPSIVTIIDAKGYNMGDSSCTSSNANRLERELRVTYGGAAIAFVSATSAGVPSGTTSLTINKPANLLQNDIMVASIAFRPYTAAITPPAGWTAIGTRVDNNVGAGSSLMSYYKFASASEPSSYTWSFDSSTGLTGGIMAFSGVNLTNPINVQNAQTVPANPDYSSPTPNVTTTALHTMVISVFNIANSAPWTPPTGMLEAVDAVSTPDNPPIGEAIEMNYVAQPISGATGVKTAYGGTGGGLAGPDIGDSEIIVLQP